MIPTPAANIQEHRASALGSRCQLAHVQRRRVRLRQPASFGGARAGGENKRLNCSKPRWAGPFLLSTCPRSRGGMPGRRPADKKEKFGLHRASAPDDGPKSRRTNRFASLPLFARATRTAADVSLEDALAGLAPAESSVGALSRHEPTVPGSHSDGHKKPRSRSRDLGFAYIRRHGCRLLDEKRRAILAAYRTTPDHGATRANRFQGGKKCDHRTTSPARSAWL
ncbi:hypothetical protein MRX96_020569 [Rhipicephalus microplus]